MRDFPFWTIGKIVRVIRESGITTFNRPMYYRLEKSGRVPPLPRTSGRWRSGDTEQAVKIMVKIWENYYGKEKANEYHEELRNRYPY